MASNSNAVWRKGRKKITGSWSYNWATDSFYISLKPSRHTQTFLNHKFVVCDDEPEFSGWKLNRPKNASK